MKKILVFKGMARQHDTTEPLELPRGAPWPCLDASAGPAFVPAGGGGGRASDNFGSRVSAPISHHGADPAPRFGVVGVDTHLYLSLKALAAVSGAQGASAAADGGRGDRSSGQPVPHAAGAETLWLAAVASAPGVSSPTGLGHPSSASAATSTPSTPSQTPSPTASVSSYASSAGGGMAPIATGERAPRSSAPTLAPPELHLHPHAASTTPMDASPTAMAPAPAAPGPASGSPLSMLLAAARKHQQGLQQQSGYPQQPQQDRRSSPEPTHAPAPQQPLQQQQQQPLPPTAPRFASSFFPADAFASIQRQQAEQKQEQPQQHLSPQQPPQPQPPLQQPAALPSAAAAALAHSASMPPSSSNPFIPAAAAAPSPMPGAFASVYGAGPGATVADGFYPQSSMPYMQMDTATTTALAPGVGMGVGGPFGAFAAAAHPHPHAHRAASAFSSLKVAAAAAPHGYGGGLYQQQQSVGGMDTIIGSGSHGRGKAKGGPAAAAAAAAIARRQVQEESDSASVSTGGGEEAPVLTEGGVALLEAVAARGAPVATAIGIIAKQKTQHTWKEEGAPPGYAAIIPNPAYEEMWDEDGTVDLLPRMRPEYMDNYEIHPRNGKAKRARREVLTTLTHEEKMERRKERARVYSHIARRRQEGFLRDLSADVDHLLIFRALVKEAPDTVLVLSPDREGRILLVEGVAAARFAPEPKALLGGSFFHLLHPEDRAAVVALFMSLLQQQEELQRLDHQQKQAAQPAGAKRGRAAAAAAQEEKAKDGIFSNCGDRRLRRGQISCRVHAQTAFVKVELTLRCGTSGVVCFARPQ